MEPYTKCVYCVMMHKIYESSGLITDCSRCYNSKLVDIYESKSDAEEAAELYNRTESTGCHYYVMIKRLIMTKPKYAYMDMGGGWQKIGKVTEFTEDTSVTSSATDCSGVVRNALKNVANSVYGIPDVDKQYCAKDIEILDEWAKKNSGAYDNSFDYEKIIFHDPATIVIWKDGAKTTAKCKPGETFDPEKGLAICFMKRALGGNRNFQKVMGKNVWKKERK